MKNTKSNTTILSLDSAVIAAAKEQAKRQGRTLPAHLENLVEEKLQSLIKIKLSPNVPPALITAARKMAAKKGESFSNYVARAIQSELVN